MNNKNKFNSIKFTIMYIVNIGSRVFRKVLLLSRINQSNHFLLKAFGVKCSGELRHGSSLHAGFYDLILFFPVSSFILTLDRYD